MKFERKCIDDAKNTNSIDEYDDILNIAKLEFQKELKRLNEYYQSKLDYNIEEKNLLDKELYDKQNEINELVMKIKSLTNTIQPKSKTSSLQSTAVKTTRFLNDNIFSCSPAPTMFQDLTNFQSSQSQQILDGTICFGNDLNYSSYKIEKKNNRTGNINKIPQITK